MSILLPWPGTHEWLDWVLPEEEAIQHIKLAYDAGIQTFDTANVYSSGESEVILGKAIRQLHLPRNEIVVMTKVYFGVAKTQSEVTYRMSSDKLDGNGYVNQYGLSRKVSVTVPFLASTDADCYRTMPSTYLIQSKDPSSASSSITSTFFNVTALTSILRSRRRCRLCTILSKPVTCDTSV
jgi:hypothetical protein